MLASVREIIRQPFRDSSLHFSIQGSTPRNGGFSQAQRREPSKVLEAMRATPQSTEREFSLSVRKLLHFALSSFAARSRIRETPWFFSISRISGNGVPWTCLLSVDTWTLFIAPTFDSR